MSWYKVVIVNCSCNSHEWPVAFDFSVCQVTQLQSDCHMGGFIIVLSFYTPQAWIPIDCFGRKHPWPEFTFLAQDDQMHC